MNTETLLALYQFHISANNTVLTTAAQISAVDLAREFSPSHGSIMKLLRHILGGDVLPGVVPGETPDITTLRALDTLETLEEVRSRFEQETTTALAYLETITDQDLQRAITITFGDHNFVLPQWQIFMQHIGHAHWHRGELSILMSELGHPLPTIDLMKYFITASGQEWPSD